MTFKKWGEGARAAAHTLVALLEDLNSAAKPMAGGSQLPISHSYFGFDHFCPLVYVLICTNLYTYTHITKTFLKDQKKTQNTNTYITPKIHMFITNIAMLLTHNQNL